MQRMFHTMCTIDVILKSIFLEADAQQAIRTCNRNDYTGSANKLFYNYNKTISKNAEWPNMNNLTITFTI